MGIKLGTLTIGNVKIGTNQISKVYNGTNIIWETEKIIYGNPYNNNNINVTQRWTSDAQIYQPLTVQQWKNTFTGSYEAYTIASHNQYAIVELLNYQNVKPLNFTNDLHDYYGDDNYTKFNIFGTTNRGYQISQDGQNWKSMQFGVDINYQALGIDYVRYMRLDMKMQNLTFTQGQTYTCNIKCTKYLQK